MFCFIHVGLYVYINHRFQTVYAFIRQSFKSSSVYTYDVQKHNSDKQRSQVYGKIIFTRWSSSVFDVLSDRSVWAH